MPTLTRLIIFIVVLVSLIYGAMVGLVAWVRPVTAELSIDIPSTAIKPRDWPYQDNSSSNPAVTAPVEDTDETGAP